MQLKKHFTIVLLFLLLTVIFTLPAVFHLSDRIIGDGGDNYQFLAFQYLAKEQFAKGQFPFGWTNYWRYPVGFNFATSYDSTLLLLVGIILYQIINNPIIVYNLSVLLFLFLDGFLSYLFFQKVTGDRLLGFIGGLIYGFSFYNLARLGGHPNLLLTGCFPLLLYALLVFKDREGDKKSFVLLVSAIILVFLTSLQYFLILGGALIFFLPLLFLFYKEVLLAYLKLFLKNKTYLLLSGLAIASVFLFFNSAKVFAVFNHTFILPTAEIVSVPVVNYLFPNVYLKILPGQIINNTKEWIEYAVFLGYLEIVLFGFFIFCSPVSKKFKTFLTAIIILFFLLPLPYPWLFKILPFRGIIEPARFYIIFYLAITLGVLRLLKHIVHSGKLVLSVVILFFFFERLPYNFALSNTLASESFIDVVKTSNSTAVLDLPLFIDWWNGNKYDLYSLYYQKPIVNGYIHWSGNTKEATLFTDKLIRFSCSMDPAFQAKELTSEDITNEIEQNSALLKELKGYDISTIVFHKDLTERSNQCQEAGDRIKILLENSGIGLIKLYDDTAVTVYQLEK